MNQLTFLKDLPGCNLENVQKNKAPAVYGFLFFCDLISLTHLLGNGALNKRKVDKKSVWCGGEECMTLDKLLSISVSLNFLI